MARRSRNRSKKQYIPAGAEIWPDGSWFYRWTKEEQDEIMKEYRSKYPNGMFGPPTGYGELVCHAE